VTSNECCTDVYAYFVAFYWICTLFKAFATPYSHLIAGD